MMVPRQLANTIALIFVRSIPASGAVAVMVILGLLGRHTPEKKIRLYRCKRHAELVSSDADQSGRFRIALAWQGRFGRWRWRRPMSWSLAPAPRGWSSPFG